MREGVFREIQPGDGLPLGHPPLDAALPGGGFPRRGLHEFTGPEDGAPTAFMAVVAGKLIAAAERPVLWASCRSDLFPPGLARFGWPVHQLLVVRGRKAAEVLWAMEEGVRCAALAGVAGDADLPGFTWSRRLQIAATRGGRPLLLLRPPDALAESSAAVTRWRVTALPSDAMRPRWQLELIRVRGAAPGSWKLCFDPQRKGLCGDREEDAP